MQDHLVLMRSLTYAQRAQRALNEAGCRTGLIRTPPELWREGCGWSVSVRKCEIREAVARLRSAGLPPLRVYARENGKVTGEVRL